MNKIIQDPEHPFWGFAERIAPMVLFAILVWSLNDGRFNYEQFRNLLILVASVLGLAGVRQFWRLYSGRKR
jgi:hypothetical protein